jgi:hypothetical protein
MWTANIGGGSTIPPFAVGIRCNIFLTILIASLFVAACQEQVGDYVAASAISSNGFAIDDEQARALDGQEIKLWGYVDHGNLYGDDSARAILEDWWSGDGPDATTWRFNLKGNAGDEVGKSFAVHVANDAGRDELLRRFVADARAQQPTKVYVTGRLTTFEAPSGDRVRTGLMLDVQSSSDISVAE